MLKITMFQTPAIELDGRPVALPFKRAEALLYYMVVRRTATRQELISLLWESCDETTGLKNLRNALYTLKKSLGGDFLLSPQKSLVTVNSQWELDSDYERFVRQGDFSAYRGPFLQGFGVKYALSFEEWLVRTREKLHEQYLGRLSQLAEGAKARGDLEEAVRQAQEYLREDPYDEETAVFLMTCYQEMRKYNKAAQVYQRLKEQLSEDLGAAPMEDTTMLYYRIMNQWNDSTKDGEEENDVPIGREDAYARLRAAANSFAAGEARRCSQLLVGEGGSGKSELIGHFLRTADRPELLTIHCDCLPSRGPNPLALWDRIMVELWQFMQNERIVLPVYLRAQLGQSFSIFREEGEQPAHRSEKALRRYDQSLEDAILLLFSVITRRRRTLLVIEDLQWIGEDSLRLADAVLRRLEGGGLMAVFTCRDHAPESVLRCLNELESDGLLHRQRLHPLTLNETQIMLSSQLGEETAQKLSAQFYRETGGNLYLLSELIRSYRRGGDVEAILRSMSDVLMERLSGLSQGAIELAELVSLFERKVNAGLLLELMDRDDRQLAEGLDALLRRGILEEHREGRDPVYCFSHQRIRELVYDRIPIEQRRLLHRRAAQLLEEEGTADSGACRRLARHFTLAQQPLQSLIYQVRALELESAHRFEPFPLSGEEQTSERSAGQLLQEAEECRARLSQLREQQGGQAVNRLENQLQLIQGRIFLFQGETERAVSLLGGLSGSADERDAAPMVQACYLLASSAIFRQEPELAERYTATGARLLSRGRDAAAYARFQRLRGSCFCLRGEYDKAEYYPHEALETLEKLPQTPGVRVQLAAVWCDTGRIRRQKSDFAQACSCYKRALALLADGAWPGKAWIYVHYGRTAFLLEDHELARQLFRQGWDHARYTGELWGRAAAAAYTAYYQAQDDDWEGCAASLGDAVESQKKLASPLEGIILNFAQMHIRLRLELEQMKDPVLEKLLPYSPESYARQGVRSLPGVPDVYEATLLADSLRSNISSRQRYRASELYSKNKHFMAE